MTHNIILIVISWTCTEIHSVCFAGILHLFDRPRQAQDPGREFQYVLLHKFWCVPRGIHSYEQWLHLVNIHL